MKFETIRCGKYVATVCRDGKIRIYEPKAGDCQPLKVGGEIVPKKGARVSWAIGDTFLIVTGFTKYIRFTYLNLFNGLKKSISTDNQRDKSAFTESKIFMKWQIWY